MVLVGDLSFLKKLHFFDLHIRQSHQFGNGHRRCGRRNTAHFADFLDRALLPLFIHEVQDFGLVEFQRQGKRNGIQYTLKHIFRKPAVLQFRSDSFVRYETEALLFAKLFCIIDHRNRESIGAYRKQIAVDDRLSCLILVFIQDLFIEIVVVFDDGGFLLDSALQIQVLHDQRTLRLHIVVDR